LLWLTLAEGQDDVQESLVVRIVIVFPRMAWLKFCRRVLHLWACHSIRGNASCHEFKSCSSYEYGVGMKTAVHQQGG
jgi:hypothetical protein